MIIDLLTIVIAVASGLPMSPDSDSPSMLCASQFGLAVQAQHRQLSASEREQVATCALAELRFLKASLDAIRGLASASQEQLPAMPASAKGPVSAAAAIVERFRQGDPDLAWYSAYWQDHGLVGLRVAEFMFDGNAQAFWGASALSVSKSCGQICKFFAMINSEPASLDDKVNYLLEKAEGSSDLAAVRLAELGSEALNKAFNLVSGPWPAPQDLRGVRRRGLRAMSVFLALRAAGDSRSGQVDFSGAEQPLKDLAAYLRMTRPLAASEQDLHFSRFGYFFKHLKSM